MHRLLRASLRLLISAASVAAVICVGLVAGVNATTAALAFLLVVLGVATKWGLREASFTSVLATLCFNYFFLPPFGTLTIADPQNWIALGAFSAIAITASQLSARARREMQATNASRNELSQLYELSRRLLMDEGGETVRHSVLAIAQTLGGRNALFYETRRSRMYRVSTDESPPESDLIQVAQTGEPIRSGGYDIAPVRLGAHIVGSLAIEAAGVSAAVCESIANLIAINYERALALERAAEAQLARRNEEFKSSLLDGLAHDLKTPLTAIRTCITRLIDLPPRTEDVRQELLSIIEQESARLQRSLTETIELARIDSSALHLDPQITPLVEVVHAAVAESREENPDRYFMNVPKEMAVNADRDLLRRAIVQIIENARKYSPPDSPIDISAHIDKESVVLAICDCGPGFAPDETTRIFEKFYRGRSGRTRDGTGMGLAIARGIVEAHGGTVTAANRASAGACVSIVLPRDSQ